MGGKYRILRRLGEGGVAEVYEAVHEEIGQRVAIKILKQAFTRIPEVADRFLDEARVAGAVGHPGIVQVFDFGHLESGEPYLVMELLIEEDLYKVLQRVKRFEPEQAIGIMLDVLDALDAAHHAGVVHRDMKPENVIVTRGPGGEPWAKIIDFGIARVLSAEAAPARRTAVNVLIGTPHYLSPEQARCQRDIDARADIYAVGVMLFELLTGKLPYEGNSAAEVVERVLIGTFPSPRSSSPSISGELERVILKATAHRREERFSSAREFRDALLPFRAESFPAASRAPPLHPDGPGADRPRRTRPLRAWGGIAAALVGVATLVAVGTGSSSGTVVPEAPPEGPPEILEIAPPDVLSPAGAVCLAEAEDPDGKDEPSGRRTHVQVRLEGLRPGFRALVDGQEVGEVFPMQVSDELHTLRVEGRGWRPLVHVFRVRGELTIPVRLKPRAPAAPPVDRTQRATASRTQDLGKRQPLGNPFGGI